MCHSQSNARGVQSQGFTLLSEEVHMQPKDKLTAFSKSTEKWHFDKRTVPILSQVINSKFLSQQLEQLFAKLAYQDVRPSQGASSTIVPDWPTQETFVWSGRVWSGYGIYNMCLSSNAGHVSYVLQSSRPWQT